MARERVGEERLGLDERVVEKLRKALGLTLYEAKLYLALLRGARGPKEASSISGVPLPRIYDVIKVLESKGFVVSDPSEWYVPVNPRSVAASAIAKLEEESRRRARMILDLADELEALYEARGDGGRVVLVRGSYSLISVASEISRRADVGYIMASHVLSERGETLKSMATGMAAKIPLLRIASLPNSSIQDLREALAEYNIEVVEAESVPIDMVATKEGYVLVLEDPRETEITGIAVIGGRSPRKVIDSLTKFWKLLELSRKME